MKKVIININTQEYIENETFYEDLSIMRDFSEKNDVSSIFFHESMKTPPILLNSKYIEVRNYTSVEDLEKKVLQIMQKNEIIFVNTRCESQIQLTNSIRKLIGQKISDFPEMFNDKSIQRELLYKNDLYVSVNYMKCKVSDLNFMEIAEKIGIPFVLKPLNGASSIGVVKIKTQKNFDKYLENYQNIHKKIIDRGFGDNDEIIAEEFINGNLYSVDYFIDQDGNARITKPIKVTLGTDIGINDMFVLSGVTSIEVEKEYDLDKVNDFIKRNIKATGMRNTFVHHEFKINKKGIYKTVEINGRIGGRRFSIYNLAYGLNLLSLITEDNTKNQLINNVSFIRICPCKGGILKKFNDKLFEKIEKLDSFNRMRRDDKSFGKEVGLTKDGFEYMGSIELVNENNKKLDKDVEFIEDNYCEMLEIEGGN